MSLAAVGIAAGATSVNKHWTMDILNSLKKKRRPTGAPRKYFHELTDKLDTE